jgi:hypothetical protein
MRTPTGFVLGVAAFALFALPLSHASAAWVVEPGCYRTGHGWTCGIAGPPQIYEDQSGTCYQAYCYFPHPPFEYQPPRRRQHVRAKGGDGKSGERLPTHFVAAPR